MLSLADGEVSVIVLLHSNDDAQFAELRGCLEAAGHTVRPLPLAGEEKGGGYVLAIVPPQASAARPVFDAPWLPSLSAREREIAELLLAHKRVPAIARQLFISPHTVRNHLKKIFAKLGVGSQQQVLDLLTAGAANGARMTQSSHAKSGVDAVISKREREERG